MPNKRAPDQTKLSISLPKSMLKKMDDYCALNDLTKSQYIRKLIRESEIEYTVRTPKHK